MCIRDRTRSYWIWIRKRHWSWKRIAVVWRYCFRCLFGRRYDCVLSETAGNPTTFWVWDKLIHRNTKRIFTACLKAHLNLPPFTRPPPLPSSWIFTVYRRNTTVCEFIPDPESLVFCVIRRLQLSNRRLRHCSPFLGWLVSGSHSCVAHYLKKS